MGSDDNVEANNGTKKTYASIVNEGKPHMVDAMESRVIKNKDMRSNRPLHGTSHDENGITLAADIDLVAFGVRKNVTAIELSRFLEKKGLPTLDCKLLTTFQGARTNSYKVTIKSCDYQKSQDPSIWLYRVRVMQFKHIKRKALETQKNGILHLGNLANRYQTLSSMI